ncbi:patatin-like phospholipase family protein [Pleomorphovibrio marinus]|uniref:patatin-like phospholipase family protein n=1 Tax=Pleomorphovibrio marinus TaxID=2164132 RepID=UPI000E0A0DC5|nr:patatin-like phospholipase family protein [Pleomorphovibrio marinus]
MKHQNVASIGIALSGGGIRGVAHLGILKAFNEKGIFPDRISGSSAGAIAGAMYAGGYSPLEILDIIIQTRYFRFIRPAISWKGLLKLDQLAGLYARYLPVDDFSSLTIPLTVAATHLQKGETTYFEKGELIKPLMASSCIPGMFDPIEIDGSYYVDGGVLNNMPVEPLLGTCQKIIGINCNHLPEEQHITNIKKLIERTVIMSMNYNVYSRKNLCDYFLEPVGLAKFGVLEIKKTKEIFAIGYESALEFMDNLPEIESMVKNKLDTIK